MANRFLPTVCIALALSIHSPAAPGDVDTTFGTAGVVTVPLSGASQLFDVVSQPDGKLVGVGYTTTPSNTDVLVMRLTANGGFDSSFGSLGIVTTPVGSGNDFGLAVAIDSFGRIVVAGEMLGLSNFDFGVVRYLSDGSLDDSFGTGGKVIIPVGQANDIPFSVAVQPDGKIVMVGRSYIGATHSSDWDISLVRLMPDGTLDSSFGDGGKVFTRVGPYYDEANRIAVLPNGKIVVSGYSYTSATDSYILAARYTSSGKLDQSFGVGGVARANVGSNEDRSAGLAVQADGKLVVGGFCYNSTSNWDFALVRFTQGGSLDGNFGIGGIATTAVGMAGDYCFGVAVQPDGRIVATGSADNASAIADIALVRYSSNGALDTTFGIGGKSIVATSVENDVGRTPLVQPNGRIVIAGWRSVSGIMYASFLGLEGGTLAVDDPIVPAPVFDTTKLRGDGTTWLDFNAPAVDSGLVGGSARVAGDDGRPRTIIYGGATAEAFAETRGADPEEGTYLSLGDPVFGGEGLGFAATVELSPAPAGVPFSIEESALQMPRFSRAVRPGGKVAALYSRLTRAAGIKRLATQASPANGGGQFAKFAGFGLPKAKPGLVVSAKLHRTGGVNAKNDTGIWKENTASGELDLLLRTGDTVEGLTPIKLVTMAPIPNATDQRQGFAPDGALAAAATFDDGTKGIVTVSPDGTPAVALTTAEPVLDEDGTPIPNATFVRLTPPATGNGGKLALAATLRSLTGRGAAPPRQAIFSNQGGTMRRVLARGDAMPGRVGVRMGALGRPLMGKSGVIGLIAALTGKAVRPDTRKAIMRLDTSGKTAVARLGDPVPGMAEGVVFRRFISMVVTDDDQARIVFTAVVKGPGVTASNNVGLWSTDPDGRVVLVMRKGGPCVVDDQPLQVRSFQALQASRKNAGQGRSTDNGFVTAKAKLSDGRRGVLRIALP